MRTNASRLIGLGIAAAAMAASNVWAQTSQPVTNSPAQTTGNSAASSAAPAPDPKPSLDTLSTPAVVPLPSTGGTGVAPPAMPGAPNASPPGAGSKP